jgi:hypothetical protein
MGQPMTNLAPARTLCVGDVVVMDDENFLVCNIQPARYPGLTTLTLSDAGGNIITMDTDTTDPVWDVAGNVHDGYDMFND